MNAIDSRSGPMRRGMLIAVVLLAFVAICGPAVHAQGFTGQGDQQLITDISSRELPDAALTPDPGYIYPLEMQGVVDASTDPAQSHDKDGEGPLLVDRIVLDGHVLAEAGAPVRVRGGKAELPPGKTHLSLSVDGKELILYVVESVRDKNFPFRHVTAAIVNQPKGTYARFTVDDWNQVLVGTLKTEGGTYRIIPGGPGPQEHLVYRLEQTGSGGDQRFITLSESIASSSDISTLEKRHVLAEILAKFQPARYYISSPVGVSIWGKAGGNNGWPTMDPARAQDPEAIAAVIKGLAPLTGARGDEKFMVERVQPARYGLSIMFRQVLRGLPVDLRQWLELNNDGTVRKLTVRLLDASWLPETTSTLLTSTAAEVLARKALFEELGGAGLRIERVEGSETTHYDIVEYGSLAPKWRSSFVTWSGSVRASYIVSIDLLTGESSLASMVMRD